jgi:AP-1 complex subunit gamma-1
MQVLAALQNQSLCAFICAVRSTKTTADERAVISKGCAAIRTSLKEGNDLLRSRNVAKLIYIHMLGYPTQFGQMECINLITSDSYGEKRVGYLGLMVLLNEKQEVITLIENHLKKDLQDANHYVQGLALATVANISPEDMSRGLSSEVLNLLNSADPYIRKKAALCALRIIRKAQTADVVDMFLDFFARTLLDERNHGVLVASIALVVEGLQTKPGGKHLPVYRQLLPAAVRMLKHLALSAYATEHDINGVADPFLQVRLLQLLRILGTGDRTSSEQMNDVLAQVATTTESGLNCGHAVLYECVVTILAIDADPGLRVLAGNILGRFLGKSNNNIRYVALNTLTKLVAKDLQAVERHMHTIVDCLQDVDISIRRRALGLTYALVSPSNVRLLVPELINYLSVNSGNDSKEDLTTKICSVVERYAPSKLWHFDTIFTVLKLAGFYVSDLAGNKLLAMISQAEPALQAYCVKVLWGVMVNNAPMQNGVATLKGSEEDAAAYCKKETLLVVTLWCVGEYGDLLCGEAVTDSSLTEAGQPEWRQYQPSPLQLLNVLTALLPSHHVTSGAVYQHAMTALLKLAGAFPEVRGPCKALLHEFVTHCELEVQQRASEFEALVDHLDRCPGLTDKMPPIETSGSGEVVTNSDPAPDATSVAPNPPPAFSGGPDPTDVLGAPAPAPLAAAAPDFLDDIFGPASTPTPLLLPLPTPAGVTEIDALLAPIPAAPVPDPGLPPTPAAMTVFHKEGEIAIDFDCARGAGTTSSIAVTITNLSPGLLYNFTFQAALPKYARLQILPLSDTSVPPSGRLTTTLVVDNPSDPHKPVAMRLRPKYTNAANLPTEQDITVTNLPEWV